MAGIPLKSAINQHLFRQNRLWNEMLLPNLRKYLNLQRDKEFIFSLFPYIFSGIEVDGKS
jgi:hypothetical protein